VNRLVIGIILLGLTGYAASEIIRFVMVEKKNDPDQFPYPRERLNRRMGIFGLMSAAVIILMIFADGRLPLIAAILLLAILIASFRLLFKDLRETRIAVAIYRRALQERVLKEASIAVNTREDQSERS
jgi:hypothetical protein